MVDDESIAMDHSLWFSVYQYEKTFTINWKYQFQQQNWQSQRVFNRGHCDSMTFTNDPKMHILYLVKIFLSLPTTLIWNMMSIGDNLLWISCYNWIVTEHYLIISRILTFWPKTLEVSKSFVYPLSAWSVYEEKKEEPTQSSDKTSRKLLLPQKNPKSNVTTHNATTNFDYTAIADWLRTVSLSNDSHPTVWLNRFTGSQPSR